MTKRIAYINEGMVQPRIDSNTMELSVAKITSIAIFFSVIAIFFILLLTSVYIIHAGERGVLLTWGNPNPVPISEGIHLKFPIAQKVVVMDIKTQKYEADLTAASKDLQDVNTKIAINYHLEGSSVPNVYQTIGTDYAAKLIFPLEQESNKAATAQFTAEELITKREEVRVKMESILRDKLAPRGIVVESISIVNFAFSPSFSAAIEAKVVSLQNALAAKNKLEQIKYEAEQKIATAGAEAESLRLQKQQVTPELIQLRQIEVQSKMADKWNGVYPTTLFIGNDGASALLPTFQVNK